MWDIKEFVSFVYYLEVKFGCHKQEKRDTFQRGLELQPKCIIWLYSQDWLWSHLKSKTNTSMKKKGFFFPPKIAQKDEFIKAKQAL